MRRKRTLTATSFAILGQLALRPWSAYELSRQMRHNFRFFWPRAESQIYAEVKVLARAKLATVTRAKTGRRSTTTYTITATGRHELAAWLARPSSPPTLEFEGLTRTFLASMGDTSDLRRTLTGLDAFVREAFKVGAHIGAEYAGQTSEFQEQIHLRAFVFDFLTHFFLTLDDWRIRTSREIESWKDTRGTPAKRRRGVAIVEGLLATHRQRMA